MAEIGSDSYEKAMQQVKKGSEGETRGLEEQIQEAKKRELENQRLKDGIDLSRRIAGESARIQAGERATASQGLELGFNTFMLTDRPTPQMSVAPKDPSDTGTTLQGIVKGTDTPSSTPDSKIEAQSTTPASTIEKAATTTQKVETRNGATEVALSGNLTSTETKAATEAQRSIESGTTSPDVMQKVKDIFNSFPDSFKKFFGPLLAMFEKLSNTENKDKNGSIDQVKDAEQKKMLDDYGVKIDSSDSKIKKLTFLSDSKVEGLKTPKPIEPIDSAKQPEKVKIPLNSDGSLSLDTSTVKTIDMVDNKDGFTMTVKNKDGSTDTYTIKSAKKTPIEAKV